MLTKLYLIAVNVAGNYRRRRYGDCSSSSRRMSMMLKNLVKWVVGSSSVKKLFSPHSSHRTANLASV